MRDTIKMRDGTLLPGYRDVDAEHLDVFCPTIPLTPIQEKYIRGLDLRIEVDTHVLAEDILCGLLATLYQNPSSTHIVLQVPEGDKMQYEWTHALLRVYSILKHSKGLTVKLLYDEDIVISLYARRGKIKETE
jgi:hypothetical protein